ncbi:NADH:flavin oxidoreductase [Bauldia sp.]|uniref:NADH:flavin oxidoreductase n=1 Tax=Bauldia sp. TaxID=2575872 RepID=UPI003BA968B9
MTKSISDATALHTPLSFAHGPTWRNRFALSPLTNTQSHADGTLHEDELNWLTMRAAGGFAMTMTCAIGVEARARGYPGQLGAWGDQHLDGLTRIAAGIKAHGSVACAQLAHSGARALQDQVGVVADPAEDVRSLDGEGVDAVIQSFVDAAKRCDTAGFDAVEVHGAHSFLPVEFLSPDINTRTDDWGGGLEGRSRFIREILIRTRDVVRPDLQLGLRLSPERFGLRLAEMRQFAEEIMTSGLIDWLDMSLWDIMKTPEEEEFAHKPLISWVTDLDRGPARLGVAGKILTAERAADALASGADFVLIGKGAILAHDFPRKVAADPGYHVPSRPVSAAFLRKEGLGPAFIEYVSGIDGFVACEPVGEATR